MYTRFQNTKIDIFLDRIYRINRMLKIGRLRRRASIIYLLWFRTISRHKFSSYAAGEANYPVDPVNPVKKYPSVWQEKMCACLRVCLKNIHRAENASFETCLSRLFRAISPIIPRKRALSQNPKSAIFISGNVFQTHSSV
jgi:hypothetical protein